MSTFKSAWKCTVKIYVVFTGWSLKRPSEAHAAWRWSQRRVGAHLGSYATCPWMSTWAATGVPSCAVAIAAGCCKLICFVALRHSKTHCLCMTLRREDTCKNSCSIQIGCTRSGDIALCGSGYQFGQGQTQQILYNIELAMHTYVYTHVYNFNLQLQLKTSTWIGNILQHMHLDTERTQLVLLIGPYSLQVLGVIMKQHPNSTPGLWLDLVMVLSCGMPLKFNKIWTCQSTAKSLSKNGFSAS